MFKQMPTTKVHIDKQDLLTGHRKGRRKVRGDKRLTDALHKAGNHKDFLSVRKYGEFKSSAKGANSFSKRVVRLFGNTGFINIILRLASKHREFAIHANTRSLFHFATAANSVRKHATDIDNQASQKQERKYNAKENQFAIRLARLERCICLIHDLPTELWQYPSFMNLMVSRFTTS